MCDVLRARFKRGEPRALLAAAGVSEVPRQRPPRSLRAQALSPHACTAGTGAQRPTKLYSSGGRTRSRWPQAAELLLWIAEAVRRGGGWAGERSQVPAGLRGRCSAEAPEGWHGRPAHGEGGGTMTMAHARGKAVPPAPGHLKVYTLQWRRRVLVLCCVDAESGC